MNVEALRRGQSPSILVAAVFVVVLVMTATYVIGSTLGMTWTPLSAGYAVLVVLLAGAMVTSLTKLTLPWWGTLTLQLVKLLVVGGTLLAGMEELVAHTSFSNRVLGLSLAPFAAVLLGIIVSYETIFPLLRWRNPDVPTFPTTERRWYVLLRGIEVAASAVGLAIGFYMFGLIGGGPVPAPAGVYPAVIIVQSSLLVMAGTTIRALGELLHYTLWERDYPDRHEV